MCITRTIFSTALTLVLATGLAACGDDEVSGTPITSPDYLAFWGQPTACGAQRPPAATEMQFDSPGDADVSGIVAVVLHTSCGEIHLELDADAVPETVNSFVFLARSGYFDGTVSHRIIPGYIVQAGDPTAAGTGNPGYLIPDELPAPDSVYTRGVVAMANSGLPYSAGSQFFIMLDTAALPPSYAVFGVVVDGFDVLDTLGGLPLGPNLRDPTNSHPLQTVYLERVEVVG